jgi:beta-N-acetylglucosaminidase
MKILEKKLQGFRIKRKRSGKLVKTGHNNSTVVALIISIILSVGIIQVSNVSGDQVSEEQISGCNSMLEQLAPMLKEEAKQEPQKLDANSGPLEANKVIASINSKLKGKLKDKGSVFYDAGKSRKVNPMLMAAIAIHETANGSLFQIVNGVRRPSVLNTCNNVAGINWTGSKSVPHKGRYRVFKDIDESIYNLAYILDSYYIKQNRTSIEDIGAKFCPSNDVDNGKYGMKNESWVPSVTSKYSQILKEAKGERS